MSKYVLSMQALAEAEGDEKAPSANSWVFCISGLSIFGC